MTDKLRKLQLVQLEILKDVAIFCDERNLTYYLFGGTLLGAIRHQGFIPWDDDVDIAMYRDDYEAFIKAFSGKYSDKYYVQNNHTDKEYSRFITKVRLNGTKQVERNLSEIQMHHGIYIDIFPLDHVPKKDGFYLKYRGVLIRIVAGLSNLRAGKRDHASKQKDLLKRTLRFFALLFPRRVINVSYDYLCGMSNKKECNYTTCFASGYGWKKQVVKNDIYSKGQKVEFEGCKFNVPSSYEAILRQVYGNYMELPPLEKRAIGHDLGVIDFGPYNCLFEQEENNKHS